LLIFRPLPFFLFPADAAVAAASLLPRAILYGRASFLLRDVVVSVTKDHLPRT
jgi:hypothetical protein